MAASKQGQLRERREIDVQGVVQGVGFRPFVFALAQRHGLSGWVRNDGDGVHVEVEGAPARLDCFLRSILDEAPPLAVIEAIKYRDVPLTGDSDFRIDLSQESKVKRALISPDVATCADCLRELFDPSNRRYRYPFINCTNCGPRFTIIRGVPYDRPKTTMAGFPMCPDCRREYDNPADRRFHAQPNACTVCGPQVQLLDSAEEKLTCDDPVAEAANLIRDGRIVAVKGLGGYHLACAAFDSDSVAKLRQRKARADKPFALMARDMDQARSLCAEISADEEALLTSSARPIVLLKRRPKDNLPDTLAPRQKTIGVMLAYTPLHHLLMRDVDTPLVMTSGNRSDEPISYRDRDALDQLGGIADYFLVHNRPIHMRCDDSVTRVIGSSISFTRRSRGYAPLPVSYSPGFERHILACGAHLKNTFCIAKERHAFVSHHIGDLDNFETLTSFESGIEHFCDLFDIKPELVAYDLHPEYLSTKYARDLEDRGLPAIGIQHHHAHIASCLADNERPIDERVIGAALDGTGYGIDGAIWGGEFFEGSIADGFERRVHLEYLPLPGGEAAIREPWRAAIGQLVRIYGVEDVISLPLAAVRHAGERNIRLIARMIEHDLNTPMTSSAGRLFDIVAALVGVPGTSRVTYEGQAAIELELAATGINTGAYPFSIQAANEVSVISTKPLIERVASDIMAGVAQAEVSNRFHQTLVKIVIEVCDRLRQANGMSAVALSGGAFQNAILFENAFSSLRAKGFTVYCHHRVPTNDGGISLGQAVLANQRFREGNKICA